MNIETNDFGLSEDELQAVDRFVPLVAYYIESQIDSLVSKVVSRYMNLPLTVEGVAFILGENPKTIYKWSDRGLLTFTKKNGRNFITIQELNHQLTNEKALNTLHKNLLEAKNSTNHNHIYGQPDNNTSRI